MSLMLMARIPLTWSFDSGGVLINGGIPVGAEIEWATTTGSLIIAFRQLLYCHQQYRVQVISLLWDNMH